jgi:hypothetical protein
MFEGANGDYVFRALPRRQRVSACYPDVVKAVPCLNCDRLIF